jgi:multicomponent K+:H+ antiporter subunit D
MSAWIDAAAPKLIVAPIVIPLAAAAVLLLIRESSRQWKAFVNLLACTLSLAVAIVLMRWVEAHGTAGAVGVYLASNWPAPFGIVLAVDRLSALMLVLTSVISIASVLFATARWQHAGVHYHSLLQIQLMGVNGAFLTADLFNLFVFFEVMLAASYGLLLHGSGRERVSAGLKYVAVNLLASSLFLIGVAIVYGITGTLNYADIAQKIPLVPAADRGLLHAGAAILGIAFLAKAAMWPLNFWLAPAYSAASASVAALFVLLTKVGVYTVLRLWTLLLSAEAGATVWFGADALVFGGLATLAFGAIGVLASHRLRRTAGFAVIISSGTLLAAIGIGHASLIGGALYYLVVSTLAVSALFLLIELIERSREFESAPPTYDNEADHLPFYLEAKDHGDPVTVEDGDDATLIGRAIPAATAFLGLAFTACALLIAGLPPLPGFLAKFAMLSALLDPAGVGTSMLHTAIPYANWALLVLLIVSGLLCMVGLSRAGVRHFWAPQGRPAPRLRIIECAPIAVLLAACAWLAIRPGPVLDYTQAAAAAVINPVGYVEAVMSATPVPPPSIDTSTPVARR